MTDVDNTSKNNQVFLLGFSLTELMLILIFGLGLLVAIGLHLSSKNESTQASDLGSCGVELETAQNNLARLSAAKSQSLAQCDSQLITLQTSHDGSKKIIIEQQETIESLKLDQLALIQTAEDQPVLAGANEEGADANEELVQLIALLEKNELYTVSALSSVENIIQQNLLLNILVNNNSELNDLCSSDAMDASDTKDANSELFNNYTSLQEDNQECLARIVNQKTKHRLDFPACWAIENGQPDYIFNITTTNAGFDVEKSYTKAREPRASKIPGVMEMQGKSLSFDEFSREANKVFSWSKDRNCRHYVRVFVTKNTSKKTDRARLRKVQSYFFVLKK